MSLRWDKWNVLCLCSKCHMYFHANPDEFIAFILQKWPMRINYLRENLDITKTWHLRDYLETEKELKELFIDETSNATRKSR